MAFDFNSPSAIAGHAIGAGAGSLLSNWQNPYDSAMPTINKIPSMVKPYYDPYIQAGQRSLPQLEGQYVSLMNNPGQKINEIGSNYHQSPGFQFALQQALQGAGHAAAAGGMAGSPQHEQQNMELATHLGDQDYNTWLQHALGAYGQGMEGEQDLSHLGYGASNEMAQTTGNMALQKALMQMMSQSTENEHGSDIFSNLLGMGGSVLGGIYGGPAGSAAGGITGNAFSKGLSNIFS